MTKSLTEFRKSFIEKLYLLLTYQWKILGVPFQGVISTPGFVIDPEALLLLSLSVFRFYPREFDEVLNWLYHHGDIINIQRLKNICKKIPFSSLAVLGAVADFLCEKQKQPKWNGLLSFGCVEKQVLFMDKDLKPYPQFGENEKAFLKHNLLRGKVYLKNKTAYECINAINCLSLNLRHLFGVNVRSEVIGYLLLSDKGNSNKISKEAFFLQKTVYEILKDLEKGHFIFPIKKGRAIDYKIDKKAWLEILNIKEPLPGYFNLVKLFSAYDIILSFLFENKENSGVSLEYSLKKTFGEFINKIEESNFSLYIPEKPSLFTETEIYETILKSIDKLLNQTL